jgi:Zn-dependent protease with chaperone function
MRIALDSPLERSTIFGQPICTWEAFMNTVSRPSLFGRALLALLLTVGFYGLALGIAFGLLYLIYLEVVVLNRINVRFTIFALIGAVVILWSILPRIDRFTAPGPRLTRTKFPRLFTEIERVASQTGQALPREVYLVPDVNAFVTERGGMMGIGSRRVMGIGFPLFHLMSVDELSAVIAHEFGHFYGGDTALGPWIYKTRAAIVRTVMNLGQTNRWLTIPFEAYANMFLRVTNTVSRQQEFSADQLAARTLGAQATIGGLQKVHKYGEAFAVYFRQEYLPVIETGYKPSLLNGFELFLKAPRIVEAVDNHYQQQLTEGKSDPYDTHPALKERIAALQALPVGTVRNNLLASTLLPAGENLEYQMLSHMIDKKEHLQGLKDIAWEQVAETAYLPQWERNVQSYKHVLCEITPLHLFEEAQNISGLFRKLAAAGKFLPSNVQPSQVPQETQLQVINGIIGSALAFSLKQNGWQIKTSPGEDLVFVKGSKELRPFNFFPHLMTDKPSRENWQEFCEENQISQMPLGA